MELILLKIELKNLSKSYRGGKTALRGLDLTLASPGLVGLVGPNGAGKSTLMKLLTAGLLPSSGEILIDGQPLLKREKALKASLGYLPQEFGLFEDLTVRQFLDYMSALKGIGAKAARLEIDRVLTLTNLQEKRRARIRTLSGGQKQRAGIAQALLGDPGLLIFDEPTVGPPNACRSATTLSPSPGTGSSSSPRTSSKTCSPRATASSSWTAGSLSMPARRSP